MAANVDDVRKSITPGSVPQGQRQVLEAGLGQVLGGGAPSPGAGGGVPPSAPFPTASDPLGALLGGQVGGNTDVPLTDGLSVGPGAGPPVEASSLMGDRAQRLRLVATQAASPMLRQIARNELRSMVKEEAL